MDTDNQANLIDLEESANTNSQPTNPDNAEQNKIMDIIGNGQLVKKVIFWPFQIWWSFPSLLSITIQWQLANMKLSIFCYNFIFSSIKNVENIQWIDN